MHCESSLANPATEFAQIVVRTWDHLNRDHFANSAGCIGTGFDRGFYRGNIASEKGGNQATADFFVASHYNVG